MTASDVEAYLARLDEPHRSTLRALRATLQQLLPDAEEVMKYGMPTLQVHGAGVAGYAAFKHHCGYYPMSGSVLDRAGEVTDGYKVSKGGLQFPPDRPLATAVVRRLVELRLDELGDGTGTRPGG